ncbi:Sec-independent protein translocase subunit TatA [Corynebacterium pacaense]|uniref:Sec-independent protein translocase subunit TatA n=1 Tax=Corynebacterium pacaense TaxID=1816684 RepID=UPI0009BB379A|nr:Sec-independent protein translocase subunit TatA [Corynebacterium pacaense]
MSLGPWEIAIIVLLIILLFGAKKLPDAARSIGRSMRIFKSEVKEMNKDDDVPDHQPPAAPQQIAAPQPNFEQHYQQEPDYRQNYEGPRRDS